MSSRVNQVMTAALVMSFVTVAVDATTTITTMAAESGAFQRAAEQVATESGPAPEVFMIAIGVAFALVFGPRIVSLAGSSLLSIADTALNATIPPALDRLRPDDMGLGWQRRTDTFRHPAVDDGGLRYSLISLSAFYDAGTDDAECAHCGADLDVQLGSADAEDVILRRARRDWMVGPLVCRREVVTNLYCDEPCEAGRLDPLLDIGRTEGEEQEMTDPLGVLNRSD